MAGTIEIGAGGLRVSTADDSRRSAGRYVLGDLLGRGGMAEVFAGHSCGDHGFQKPVAIKRLLPELASDDVFVDRLIDEAKLLVGMAHGNIVSVIDLARDGDDVFLVMEFVDGPSLRQLIKAIHNGRPRALPLGIATYIVQSAAQGLAFAHGRPGGAIIHADISPSNLLLTTSGEVRVADFGIARREGALEGAVEGKWAYMAPEQARGEELTPASDVFALGAVLYELVCGQHPLGLRITADERESRPLRIVPPSMIDAAVPPGLDAICMRALARDPRDRYQSMQALIDALVEERYANHYREGASDLASLIRQAAQRSANMVHVHASPNEKTSAGHGQRPMTIATRSLLREVTPRPTHSHSYPSYASGSQRFAVGTRHERPLPAMPAPIAEEPSRKKWAFGILAFAALAGAIAAVGIQMAPSDANLALSTVARAPVPQPRTNPLAIEIPDVPAPVAAAPAPAPTIVDEPAPIEMDPAPITEAPQAPKRAAATPTPKRVVKPGLAARGKPGLAARGKEGTLRLKAYPWAWAFVNNQKIEAPKQVALPEGKYTVKFQNPENGKHVYRTVVVEGGKVATATVNWEDEE